MEIGNDKKPLPQSQAKRAVTGDEFSPKKVQNALVRSSVLTPGATVIGHPVCGSPPISEVKISWAITRQRNCFMLTALRHTRSNISSLGWLGTLISTVLQAKETVIQRTTIRKTEPGLVANPE